MEQIGLFERHSVWDHNLSAPKEVRHPASRPSGLPAFAIGAPTPEWEDEFSDLLSGRAARLRWSLKGARPTGSKRAWGWERNRYGKWTWKGVSVRTYTPEPNARIAARVRRRSGMKRYQMAPLLGMSSGNLRRIETGSVTLPDREWSRLIRMMNRASAAEKLTRS